eukprot:6455267-Amphidinium_carterae.1
MRRAKHGRLKKWPIHLHACLFASTRKRYSARVFVCHPNHLTSHASAGAGAVAGVGAGAGVVVAVAVAVAVVVVFCCCCFKSQKMT